MGLPGFQKATTKHRLLTTAGLSPSNQSAAPPRLGVHPTLRLVEREGFS